MKIAKPLILLAVFMTAHAVFRFLFLKVVGSYEMTLPHCCQATPVGLSWVIKVSDLFSWWPSLGGYPIISDLFWGCVGLAVYLGVEKWRTIKRTSFLVAQMSSEVQTDVWPPSPKAQKPAA